MSLSATFAAVAAFIYAAVAEVVAVHAVIEIGPNLLAAITSIIGAVVVYLQLRINRRVEDVKQTADDAHTKADEVGAVVEMRKTDRGPGARKGD